MKNNFVAHFEIYADNADELRKFYTDLFDWEIQNFPELNNYGFIKTVDTDEKGVAKQPGGINGGIMNRPEGYTGHAWINYVNVESVEEYTEKALKLGATLMKGKSPVKGMGWFAMLKDPQGSTFAIWQTDSEAK
jgi:uncharacterized protein